MTWRRAVLAVVVACAGLAAARPAEPPPLDRARALGLPEWPDDLGRMDPAAARDARAILGPAVASARDLSEAREIGYRAGLAWLEPVPGRDPARALAAFSTVVATGSEGPWTAAASYALGWMAEIEGEDLAARGAYERILLDAPSSQAASRAEAALGRLAARRGDLGAAAALFAASASTRATPEGLALLEGSIRALMRGRDPRARWGAKPVSRTILEDPASPTSLATSGAGTLLVGERKPGRVSLFDASGTLATRWSLDDVRAVAFDSRGRGYAATSSRVVRLDDHGPHDVASTGDFCAVRALAIDGEGGFWLVDRRGRSLGRIPPGASEPIAIALPEDTRLGALANGVSGVVAVEDRRRELVSVFPDGRVTRLASLGGASADAIAADLLGHVAILDERSGAAILVGPRGDVVDRVDLKELGVSRPAGIALASDGSVAVLDTSRNAVVRLP